MTSLDLAASNLAQEISNSLELQSLFAFAPVINKGAVTKPSFTPNYLSKQVNHQIRNSIVPRSAASDSI